MENFIIYFVFPASAILGAWILRMAKERDPRYQGKNTALLYVRLKVAGGLIVFIPFGIMVYAFWWRSQESFLFGLAFLVAGVIFTLVNLIKGVSVYNTYLRKDDKFLKR